MENKSNMTASVEPLCQQRGWLMHVQVRTAVVLILAGLALPSSLIQARNIREDPRVVDSINLLDRWIDAQREYDQFPGISMAPVERGVDGLPHHTHPTLADLLDEAVMQEPLAGLEDHDIIIIIIADRGQRGRRVTCLYGEKIVW